MLSVRRTTKPLSTTAPYISNRVHFKTKYNVYHYQLPVIKIIFHNNFIESINQ